MSKAMQKRGKTSTAVGAQIQRTAKNQFVTISEVIVPIPLDEDAGYIYPMGRKNKSGDYLFGLLRPALDDIKEAAGIQIMESYRADDRSDPMITEWQVRGQREHPDGFMQTETASYTLDLRFSKSFDPEDWPPQDGGGRYAEAVMSYFERALEGIRKSKKLPWQPPGTDRQIMYAKLQDEMGEKWVMEQRAGAHLAAVELVMSMRAHMDRRAETGAIHALIRNLLGVQHSYTKKELAGGITVIRSQYNQDALSVFPEDVQQRILAAQYAQLAGIRPEYIQAILPAPKEEAIEGEVEIGDGSEPGGIDLDAEEIEPEEPECDEPAPVNSDLGERLEKLRDWFSDYPEDKVIDDENVLFKIEQVFAPIGELPVPENLTVGVIVKTIERHIE